MGRLDPRCDAPGRRVDVREALLERRVDEHDERLLSLLSGCREAGELGGDVELHHVLELHHGRRVLVRPRLHDGLLLHRVVHELKLRLRIRERPGAEGGHLVRLVKKQL